MRRGAALALAVVVCGCQGRAGALCNDDDDCGGAVCLEGACVVVDVDALAISGVDGDGVARESDIDAVDRAAGEAVVATAHRLVSALVVDGRGFGGVDRVFFVDGDDVVDLTFTVESAVRLRAALPALAHGGLFSLVVAAGADEARAQVFVLQGEPGKTSLSAVVAATDDECAFGGDAFVGGFDDDGDGALDDAEVDRRDVRCDAVVRGVHDVRCADEACLRDTLLALAPLRLSLDATVNIAADDVALSAPLFVQHPDGARVVLSGHLSGDNGVVVLSALTIDTLRIDVEAVGVNVNDGGKVNATDLVIAGATSALVAGLNATAVVSGLEIVGGVSGVQAVVGGAIFVVGLHCDGAEVCLSADTNGVIIARDAIIDGGRFGAFANRSGVVDASNGVVTAAIGAGANLGGVVIVDGGVYAGDGDAVVADFAGVVSDLGAAADFGGAPLRSRAAVVIARGGAAANVALSANAVVAVPDPGNCAANDGGRCTAVAP